MYCLPKSIERWLSFIIAISIRCPIISYFCQWVRCSKSTQCRIVHSCSVIQKTCIAGGLQLLAVEFLFVDGKLCIGRVRMLAPERIVVISLNHITAVVGYYPCASKVIGDVVVRKNGVVGVDEPSPSECRTLKCPYRAAPGVYQRTEVIVPVGGVIYNSTLCTVCQPCVRRHCCTILTERLLQVKKIIGNCQTVYRKIGQLKIRTQAIEP